MTLLSLPGIKSFYLESLGCAKNQVDSETIISSLKENGLNYLSTPEDADLIIINTCGFIEPAKKEAVETMFSFRAEFPKKIIIGTGCFVQRYSKKLTKQMKEIDGFIGNRSPEHFCEALFTLLEERLDKTPFHKEKRINKKINKKRYIPTIPSLDNNYCRRTENLSYPRSRFVKIGEGCSNWCRYCAIPLIRGELRSRPVKDIIKEIADLLAEGCFEINLISQDLANYGKDFQNDNTALAEENENNKKTNLFDLLTEISKLKGKFWIRLLYIHPDHFPFNIFPILKNDSRFLPYFDIPFQHASPSVLAKMGRKGNPQIYTELIQRIRKEFPLAAIRTTIMTGFPSEKERDMEILLDFQRAIKAEWLGVFSYSREQDTPAYNDRGRVREDIKQQRKETIEIQQIEITGKQLDRYVGLETEVLIETPIEKEELSIGRCIYQAPEVDGLTVVHGKFKPGELLRVKIVARNGVDWEALPV